MKSKWVLLHYSPYEPVRVYGTFDTEDQAYAYAEQEGFNGEEAIAAGESAYEVRRIRNVKGE